MNIPELIKKIREAQKNCCDNLYWNKEGKTSLAIKQLDEVIKELEQQIDDGK